MDSPTQNPLAYPIDHAKGVGPKLAKLLARKGVSTFEDALYFLPRAYEDRSRITPIAQLTPGMRATVFARILSKKLIRQGRRFRFEAVAADATGKIHLVWFHAFPSLATEFAEGRQFVLYGMVEGFRGKLQMAHPDHEAVEALVEGKLPSSYHFGRVVPIYSETEGLNQKFLRKVVAQVLKQSLPALEETLPEDIRKRHDLPGIRESFASAHFPKDLPGEELSPAHRRLVFEEFFALQLGLSLRRKESRKKKGCPCGGGDVLVQDFLSKLPFSLTGDQNAALQTILYDLAQPYPMTRLLQGDVGSGKTVVALAACAAAIQSGYQAAIMAPTEILAEQHLQNAQRWLPEVPSVLLVGSNSGRKEAQDPLSKGMAKLVIGTHALFQKKVRFSALGLVVVDEQHRFGVEQRSELVRKGEATGKIPHLLMMTATPIPRTLALTVYGDLELSLIRHKPSGRSPVVTRVLSDRRVPEVYRKIRETVSRGEQVYLIYPLIEESEKLALKSAVDAHDRLSREVFPELSVALLHGRMKASEKEEVLKRFKAKEFQVLVATTVIEVGIDVPNATLMIIEHAERLGLSQLHQLRGRVGRGSKASECILVASGQPTARLQIMEQTEDGFIIAEEDLKFRGPGDFLGTRQSGLPGFRVAHLLRDSHLLTSAKEEVDRILAQDPDLLSAQYQGTRKLVEERWDKKIERLQGG